MRRIVFETCVMAVAAVVMASAVLVGGAALPLPIEPFVLVARQIEIPASGTGTCFEAPATVPSTSVTAGVGTLCVDGHDLDVTLQVAGLTIGREYIASLRYTLPQIPCDYSLCAPIDVPGGRPSGLVKHIDAGIASPSGVLRVQKSLNDSRFRSGGEVKLELLTAREHADPQAEAVFILP